MNAAKLYGNLIWREQKKDPAKAGRMISAGLHLYAWSIRHFPHKGMPKAYQYLNDQGLENVAKGLDDPGKLAWTNIFAPVEILECFGLTCVSMECLSSYLSGFYIEDRILDKAESEGIASTLCSYHRGFIGAVDKGILPLPEFAVTTSMVCDANINTFRYMEEMHGVKSHVIDIPHDYSPEAEHYVVEQLRDLIRELEEKTGRKLDMEELKNRLRSENRAKAHLISFMKKRRTHAYPQTMTLVLFQLFASHLNIGTEWSEKVFEMMDKEVESYPDTDEKKIMWLHVEPYAQPTLQSYFNYGDKISISCDDFDLDYIEPLDAEHPLEALARKMICNIYNGDYSRKTDAVADYIREFRPDGVIQFCSWGCKQSAGGVGLMKEKMHDLGVPMLILDGDAIDRRNCPDGQIKTRLEAFLELLNSSDEKSSSRDPNVAAADHAEAEVHE